MKNLINYYYDLNIKTFKKIDKKFIFELNNKFYEFIPFYGDINLFYKNYLTVLKSNRYCHEIVFNNQKNILTFYEGNAYLLLRKNLSINNRVDLNEIINYDIPIYNKAKLEWKKLWKEKIDYYEYQMSQLSHKYKTIKNSFDYYIGLSENAILLLNYINEEDIKFYMCHRRIEQNEKLDDFFNPLNFVVDNISRDIGEYIKVNFFTDNLNLTLIYTCINKLRLTETECILLLARLMYPSFYFDLYDKIIQDEIAEEKIKLYTKKNASYETFLKKMYNYLKSNFNIPNIEWFEN